MLYEIRAYEAVDGKAAAMRDRFKTEVVPRLPRHGIELIGVLEAPEEEGGLACLTRFKSEEDRALAWAASGADPEWRRQGTDRGERSAAEEPDRLICRGFPSMPP